MSEVTRILHQIQQGDPHAAGQLLPLVYDELRRLAARKLAREQPGQTLQATALVHEAYLRLVGQRPGSALGPSRPLLRRGGRGHAAHPGRACPPQAEAQTRGRSCAPESEPGRPGRAGDSRDPVEVLAVHEALDQLAAKAPRKAELVKLRYFLGCTMAEAAQVLGIAQATAEEDWTYSKAWLRRQWLRGEQKEVPG